MGRLVDGLRKYKGIVMYVVKWKLYYLEENIHLEVIYWNIGSSGHCIFGGLSHTNFCKGGISYTTPTMDIFSINSKKKKKSEIEDVRREGLSLNCL